LQNSLLLLFFSDDLHDARNQLADLNRRLHELEIELRRLENEREELTAAYKEAEAVSVFGMTFIKLTQKKSVMHDCYSLTYPLRGLL
jgi:phage shock protein A